METKISNPELKAKASKHAAVLAGEPLRSAAARFGVLYTAAGRRARDDKLDGKPWREPPAPSNVVQLFRRGCTP